MDTFYLLLGLAKKLETDFSLCLPVDCIIRAALGCPGGTVFGGATGTFPQNHPLRSSADE